MNLEGLKIAFLGDSITEGVGAGSSDTVYHSVLKKTSKLAEALNYGVSGTRFARQNLSPVTDEDKDVDINSFSVRVHNMSPDADAVVVFGGTNDFGHGDAPLGSFDDRTPMSFYGACHYIFSELIRKYTGKPIIIMTPLHRIDEVKNNPDGSVKTLDSYVDAIIEVARYYSLPVLDLYASCGIQPAIEEVKNLYLPDGLHPNDNGNAVIAQKLRKFMESL